MKVDVAGWVYWKLGRSGEAGLRAAMCADALMLSEGAGGSGRRRVEVRWSELNGGKGRGVDARMQEFVGKEALREVESCMPKGGGSDRDVLLVRVMLSSGRDGGHIRMASFRDVHTRDNTHYEYTDVASVELTFTQHVNSMYHIHEECRRAEIKY